MALVEKKVKEGKIEAVESIEESEFRKSADVIDLTELLKRSLKGGEPHANRKSKKPADENANVSELKSKPPRSSRPKAGNTPKKPASASKKLPEKNPAKTTRKRKGA